LITLKEALHLPQEEIIELKKDLTLKINASNIGAYVEQHTGDTIATSGDGVPIMIKDNIQVDGWNIACASKILEGYIAPYNATVIEKLFANGASAFGRANMDQFAMGSTTASSYFGKTLNPVDTTKVPGGSSGGSAAAVAGGIAIAALGSDTGGSIRQPAAFCGCVGMKPTYGRVSRYGLSAFSSSLDQIGPLTQNVEDAAILFDMISGNDPKDATSAKMEATQIAKNIDSSQKMKIAVLEDFLDESSPEIKKATQETIEALKKEGHEIVYKTMSGTKYHVAAYYVIATAEASANLQRYDGIRYGFRAQGDTLADVYKNTRSEGFGDEVKRRILLGNFVLSSGYYDAYYVKAQKVRHLIKDEFDAIFADADLILAPVTPTTAFSFDAKKSPLEMYLEDIYTISVNLAGLPALSLPIGKDSSGLPIGMQLIANAFDEQKLFNGASTVEAIIN
jgi:aspartyl-tRNA(Asn)/glutamyl-tRNA(Gln) amidotransferase subunit A